MTIGNSNPSEADWIFTWCVMPSLAGGFVNKVSSDDPLCKAGAVFTRAPPLP